MRLLMHANAPWAGSGYGVQAKLFAPRLKAAGHDSAVSAFYGLNGGILKWGDVPVYPGGHAPYGTDVAVAHAGHFHADAIIALMDAWVLGPMISDAATAGLPIWCWSPVDQGPVPKAVVHVARQADAFLCYSQWGTQEALDAGIETASYMPLGVDTNVMRPMDKAEARRIVGLPEDASIAGMVAANKCPYSRKAWAQALEGFATFAAHRADAHLYLHTEITQAHGGWDITAMIRDFGLSGRVTVVDRYLFHLGLDDAHMRAVFNAMDVLLSPSMGEGFGVPIVEAQACGTPVIIGDWTSMPELFGQGYVIDKRDAMRWQTLQGGFWYIPNPDAIADALEEVYAGRSHATVGTLAKAAEYDADLIVREHWLPFLERKAAAKETPAEPAPPEIIEVAA